MAKNIWLNFPKAHSACAAALRVLVVRSGGKFTQQAQRPLQLLRSQDSTTERQTGMRQQICLHLNLMKSDKSSLFMQNTPSSVRCWSSHSLIPRWFLGSIPHCLKCRTPESPPCLVLVSYRLWSTNLNCSMPFFLHLYLLPSELSPSFFENGIPACWAGSSLELLMGTGNSSRQATNAL